MTVVVGLFNCKKSVLAVSELQVNDLEGSNLMTMTSFDTLSEAKNGLESHLQCEFSSLIRTKAAASFCCQNLHLEAWTHSSNYKTEVATFLLDQIFMLLPNLQRNNILY